MATLRLYRQKLKNNYDALDTLFKEHNVTWSIVTKLFCGNPVYLKEILDLGTKQVCDSRISNLRAIKKIDPNVDTIYIKPPPKNTIKNVVRFADISMNTEFSTIKLLGEEAKRRGKIHHIIIMVELGDLREGVMGENLMNFYSKVFKLKGIKVVGIGANLNCLNGVMPSLDKMVQLALYKELLELKFNRKIPFVSGGSSVTIPLIYKNQLPKDINHLRVGESLFFGNNLFTGKRLKGLYTNVFEFSAEIIELTKKPFVPHGELAANPSGEEFEVQSADYQKESFRAIIDIGLLDINPDFLTPIDKDVKVIGASSDMLVLDLGPKKKRHYKVGGEIRFKVTYMGVLGLMNSNYVDKIVV